MPSSRLLGRGAFFVLDGIDGCGKTTQVKRLADWLEEERGEPLVLREPGSTPTGEGLRELLLDPDKAMEPATETLLFVAARRQMLGELVAPALASGRDVVCDRFHPSTFAYQAVAGRLPEEAVLALMHTWAGSPVPDRILLLDLPVEVAWERACQRGSTDRFEGRGREFQERVAEGYRRYAGRSEGVSVVDANGSAQEVAARVLVEVRLALR